MSKVCRERDVYAAQTGDYVGQMFIVIKITKEYVACLSVPTMENVKIPLPSFELGRNNNIIKYVERIPRSVYKVSAAQYNKNENSNN